MRLAHSCRLITSFAAAILAGCDGPRSTEPIEFDGQSRTAVGVGQQVAAPSSATAAAVAETRVDVAWQDNSTNESSFEIQRSSTGAAGPYEPRGRAQYNATQFVDWYAQAGTTYCYRIRAVRTTGTKSTYSDFSNVACATTPSPPPPPPPPPPSAASNLDAFPLTSSQMYVRWDDSGGEDGSRLERSMDGGASWSTLATVPRDSWSFYDTGLQAERRACYRIIAFNTAGDAAPSNTDCATPPAGPTNLSGIAIDSTTVDLSWTDNSSVEDGYEVWMEIVIYNADCDAGCFTDRYPEIVAILPANSTTYRCTQCMGRPTYVRAHKDGGNSDFSNTIEVQPQ